MTTRPNRRLDEVRDLRAMAHPLRVRLYYALQALEAATATRLAESVGESPALVSYHLRQLRDHGFVEEAPDLVTDRRERWWRPATEGFRFSLVDVADHPERRGAAVSLQRTALANQLEKLEAFRDEQAGWGAAWSEAAFSSDSLLRLTPDELDAMHEELQAVLRRWREHGRRADAGDAAAQETTEAADETVEPSAGPQREHVFVFTHAFPFRP